MVNDLPMMEFFIKTQGAIKNDGFDKVQFIQYIDSSSPGSGVQYC